LKKNKIVSILVVMFFMLSCFSPASLAGPINDLTGHWAEAYIGNLVDQGIISGYPDGTFKPEGKITRAEFASILVKGFELPIEGSKVFSDTADHWAKNSIAAAYSQGIINGYSENEFGPDDPITREQMAVMIVKAAQPNTAVSGKTFADSDSISEWAREAVSAATGNKIINGYPDNTFRPKGNTTRAEAAVVLSKSLQLKAGDREEPTPVEEDYSFINKAGTYGPAAGSKTVAGNVTVQSPNVTLRNLTIQGDLIIAEEVGDGDVNLNNVTVKGKTYVRGGGSDSIHINGGLYHEIIVEKTATGAVRIVAIDSSGLKVVISDKADGEKIILEGSFKSVIIKAEDVDIATQGETSIDDFKVESGLDDVNIELSKDTVVNEINLNSKVTVKGDGTIKEATGSKAKESSFATAPDKIAAPSAGGGGGGGGGSPSTVEVSAISVEGVAKVGETLTAKVTPTGATVNYQWMRADAENGEYEDIDDATNNTYELVANDAGKYIKVKATGRGNYRGTVESEPVGPVEEEPQEPAIIADPGVSPADGATVEGVQAFTFGFKSATGNLEELELDVYLGDNTGANRDYAEHLGINLPAGSEAVEAWVDQVVASYDELDEKYPGGSWL